MRRLRRLGLAARIALALVAPVACSPYEPSLPTTPFLCGDQEPRCPEGFACVTDQDGRRVCRAEGAVDAGLPDAAAPAVTGP